LKAEDKSIIEKDNKEFECLKKMSVKNLEQCGRMAEQLICLRNDLDHSHFSILKMKKQSANILAHNQNTSFDSELKRTEASIDLVQGEGQNNKYEPFKYSQRESNRSLCIPRKNINKGRFRGATQLRSNIKD